MRGGGAARIGATPPILLTRGDISLLLLLGGIRALGGGSAVGGGLKDLDAAAARDWGAGAGGLGEGAGAAIFGGGGALAGCAAAAATA